MYGCTGGCVGSSRGRLGPQWVGEDFYESPVPIVEVWIICGLYRSDGGSMRLT
jgi:hypothetical protein